MPTPYTERRKNQADAVRSSGFSVAEIEREPTGTWREEHLQNLGTALEMYEFLCARIDTAVGQIA